MKKYDKTKPLWPKGQAFLEFHVFGVVVVPIAGDFACGSKSPAISHVDVIAFWPCKLPKPLVFHNFSSCFWIVVMKNVKKSMLFRSSHANAMRI